MNLKKAFASLFVASAIVGSMLAPVVADSSQDAVVTAPTSELGTLSGPVWVDSNSIQFDSVGVDFQTGGSKSVDKSLTVTDTQASSNGWKVQYQSTNLTGTENPNAFIEAKQVTIRSRNSTGLVGKSCTEASRDGVVVNPSNAFQTHWFLPYTSNAENYAKLDQPVKYVEVSEGRGCGEKTLAPRFGLNVLPGQNVDTYQGTITATLIPAEPAPSN